MVPVQSVLSPLAQSEWQKRVVSMTKNSNHPRWVEFMSEKTMTITEANGQPTMTYRELKLHQKSKTYSQVIEGLNGWQRLSGEEPSLKDLISLKYTVDMSRATPGDGSGYPLYIAMHGGGGPTDGQTLAQAAASNDEQWWEMASFYKGAGSRHVDSERAISDLHG